MRAQQPSNKIHTIQNKEWEITVNQEKESYKTVFSGQKANEANEE